MATTTIKLPNGFVLDEPNIPEGFVLDKPNVPDGFVLDEIKQKPSFLKSAIKAPIAGVGDAIEMYSRALRTADPEGGWDVVRNVATKGVGLGKSISEKFPTENEDFGLVKRGVVGGIRSSVPSVAAGVPGAIAGMAGGIPGIVGGYAGSGAIITGAAEYDRFLELADQYGIPKDIARSGAIKSALVEGGIEGAANALDAILLKAGSPVVSGFKQFAKNALKIGGVESGTEAIQAALEAKIARDVGIPAPHPLEAAKESVIPALTMGGIMGAGGTMANKMLSKPVKAQQTEKQAIIDPFDNQIKPPQIQQTEKQEVVLPPGEKPLIQPPPVVKPPEGFILDKPIQPLPKPENVEIVKPQPKGFTPIEASPVEHPIEKFATPPKMTIKKPEMEAELLHNNEPVTKIEAKNIIAQSQQDYSPKAIKQHKEYLFDQIDEAIKNAQDYEPQIPETDYKGNVKHGSLDASLAKSKEDVGFITIEVPGDGKFRIINSKQSLTKFKNDVVAKFPTTKISNTQKIGKAPMGIVADKAVGIDDAMEGTYNKQSIHGNTEMVLFTPLKTKPKSYKTDPDGARIAMPSRIDDLIDKETPHYNVDDIVFFVQKTDEAEGISDIPLPHLKEDMAVAELYAGDKYTLISQKYYNYIKAHFPDATFKITDRSGSAIQIYSNKKLVGLVMPLEIRGHAPHKQNMFNPKGEIAKEPTGTADAVETIFGEPSTQPKGFTPIEAAPVVSKEPWQMTSKEYYGKEKEIKIYDESESNPAELPWTGDIPVDTDYLSLVSGEGKLSETKIVDIKDIESTEKTSKEQVDQLKEYIKDTNNDLPPIVVERDAEGFFVVDGNSRLQAAKELGYTKIPVKEYELPTDISHEQIVKQALSEGKPVPSEVLKDYPELQQKVKYTQPKLLEGEKTNIAPKMEADIQGQQKMFGNKPTGTADAGGYAQSGKLDKLKQSLINKQYDPSIPLSHYRELGKPAFITIAPKSTTQEAFHKLRTLLIDNRKGYDIVGGKPVKTDADYLSRDLSYKKPPAGMAEAGGYIPTKEQTQYAGAERQAQELPEVVELYNEISKGKYPAVERHMKDKLGYYSPVKDKIGLRQDLPIGERIELSPHIEGFKNVLTTVPELSIRKGDIIIERDTIAVSPRVFKTISQEFENYMRKESGLTEEQIAFKKDFNKKTRMYELRAYKKDKTLALKVLSHEVFHYVDALPDQAKRGNVLGHIATLKKYLKHMLDTFPTSAEADINETKIELRKQSLREAKGQPEFWKAANQRYKELLAQTLSEREVITKQEIIAELKALTQKVKPFDDTANPKFKAYRYSPKELYADAGGALLWNPKLLQETAPKFYKSFFAYLERKPEVKQTYDAIQNKLGMIPGLRRDVVIQGRIERMKEGYGRGRKARKEMEERRKSSAESIVDTILNQAVDDEHANLKRIRTLEKKGGSDYEIGRKARLSIEELKMIDSKIENYINHFTKEVDAEMLKNNITLDDMGVFAQASRVKEERGKLDIFNPGGETLESSQEMLSHLQQEWGQEKFAKVSELFDKFQELRQTWVMPALETSKRYDPELVEYAKTNLFYTRFSVSKYLTERFGGQITGTIYKQYGTLSEIESPIEATIIQDIMLIRAAKVNELKLDMVDVLKRTNELTPAEIDKSTTKWQPKPPPDRNNYGVFTVMRDGKAEHYYVDKQIVDSFQFEPYRAKQISAIVHMISEPFRRLFVTRNPRWMFKNPIRDIKSTIKQVPEIKLRNIPEFMLDYGRGVKESFSDVFLGKRSEDISNLMEKEGLVTGRYYDQDNFETKIEELQSQFSLEHHPKKVEGAWNRLKRVYQIIDRQFDKAGRVSDISTKMAGYKYLKKHSTKSEREIMHDVRTLVGTPNSRRQGRLHWLSNNIFMFSNIGKEGLRSSWESFRTKPTAYLWKTSALNVLPLLTLLGAGAAGVEWVKKILEELSQYDLESKTIIPTPYTVNNKPVAIAIPEDYQGMVVRKLVFNIMNKDVGGSLKALWDAKPYQWHPMIKIGNALFQYYILGNNPKDTFRNRDIIPRDKFEVGGLTASNALLKHTWNELGGSLFYRFPYDDVKEDFKSIETLKKTFPMNALGDFLIISNEGIKQSSYKIQDRLNQAYEKRRFDVKQEIKKSINSSETRKTDKEILKELYIPLARKKLFDYKNTSPTEFINKYRRLESKKEDNPYLDSLENAHRNEVKEALLNEYSQKLSRKELLQLLSTALKEKIITDEFTKNYLIKRKPESSNR